MIINYTEKRRKGYIKAALLVGNEFAASMSTRVGAAHTCSFGKMRITRGGHSAMWGLVYDILSVGAAALHKSDHQH